MGAAVAVVLAVRLLTLEEAVRTAEENAPTLRQARAQTRAAEARSDQAFASFLPQLSASAQYQRTTANFALRPGSVPSSLSATRPSFSWDTFNFFNFGLNASQTIWDFQAFDRYRASRATIAAQGATEETTRQQAVASVRAAFFAARAQKALVDVARATLQNQDRHLAQISGFVRLGSRAEIDLVQVRAERASARVQLINAENAYATAKAQLNQAMGIEGPTDYDVSDETQPPVAGEDAGPEELVAIALKDRPEFRALEQQLRAQELSIGAVRGAYFPAFTTSAALTGAGTDITALGWNLNVGVGMSWAIFSGGLTRAQVREAEANLAALEAQRAQVRLQARLEVEQTRLGVRAAREALVASEEALVNATERLRLAEGRYQTGVGNIIELGDAQVQQTSSAAQKVQAEYNLASARAALLRALGRK